MGGALDGIRVVDLSHVLAAPTTTMILADLGAEVIHIEPEGGDDAREYGPFIGGHDKNRSGYFISLNRNKKSLVLNLKADPGKQILKELIRVSDVVVENFRPTTMKKLGFDWTHIQKINPRVVYCSICGFGHDSLSENTSRPAYDMVAQAYSGMMSITGPEGGPPCRVGSSIGDILAGHQAVIGILAALVYRDKTGRGQYLDISMVDSLFSVLENAVARVMNAGEIPEPLGSMHPAITPFQAFKARDHVWIIAAVGNDNLWAKFCHVLERKDLIDDPRFKNNSLRTENRKALIPILEAEMEKKTAKEWSLIFEQEGIPYSPVNTVKDICEDPHIAHREMLVAIDQPVVGKMKICGSPFRLSETPGKVVSPAPMLGEHTDQVLGDIPGYSQEKIDRLKSDGIINRTV